MSDAQMLLALLLGDPCDYATTAGSFATVFLYTQHVTTEGRVKHVNLRFAPRCVPGRGWLWLEVIEAPNDHTS